MRMQFNKVVVDLSLFQAYMWKVFCESELSEVLSKY